MQLFAFLAVLFITAISASQTDLAGQTYVPASDLRELAKSMPESSLPPPDGLKLKYILLGIGTQNYTCTGQDENAVPGTVGAVGKQSSLLSTARGPSSPVEA
jgi:hypothetical protein